MTKRWALWGCRCRDAPGKGSQHGLQRLFAVLSFAALISSLETAFQTLPLNSVVRTAKIATVEMDMADRIGRLDLPERRRVIDAVRDRLAVAGICAVNTG